MTATDELDPRPIVVGIEAARAALHRAPDDDGAVEVENARREAMAMRDSLRAMAWHGVIPNRFAWATLADLEGTVRTDLEDWSSDPRGRNLVLLGPVGTGKTHAAVAAVRRSFERGLDVRFLPIVELLDQLRPGGPEGALLDLGDVDRLIVDDVGSERATDWTGERLFALVNRRWLEELPTIVTSNLTPEALEEAVGARTFSRLVGNDAVVVKLKGKDRRRSR